MSSPLPSSLLIPIRVDVTTAHPIPVRFIDTFLFDPTVWPIPLSSFVVRSSFCTPPSNHADSTTTTTHEWIRHNAIWLARTMLSDVECSVMTRTARSLTGRFDATWYSQNPALLVPVVTQIEAQLRTIVQRYGYNHIAGGGDGDGGDNNKVRTMINKKRLRAATATTTTDHHNDDHGVVDAMATTNPNRSSDHQARRTTESTNTTLVTAIATAVAPTSSTAAIPVKLRVTIHGIRIHDDFFYDSTVPGVNPVTLAQRIGQDLHLSDDITAAVAIEIAEQVMRKSGRRMLQRRRPTGVMTSHKEIDQVRDSNNDDNDDDDSDDDDDDEELDTVGGSDGAQFKKNKSSSTAILTSTTTTTVKNDDDPHDGGPMDRRYTTAAWVVDPKIQNTRFSQWMQQYGPTTPKGGGGGSTTGAFGAAAVVLAAPGAAASAAAAAGHVREKMSVTNPSSSYARKSI